MNVLRFLAAPIVGLIALVITVMVVEAISHKLFMPAEQQAEFARLGAAIVAGGDGAAAAREELRALMGTLPAGAIWGVVVAWTLGALVGGRLRGSMASGQIREVWTGRRGWQWLRVGEVLTAGCRAAALR